VTDRNDVVDALAASWFGGGLPKHALRPLAELAERRTLPEGSVILREGQPADQFGIVLSGRLCLRILVPERGMVTILTVEPGDMFGWSAIVAPHRSTSTVIVCEESEVLLSDGAHLRRLLAADDALAATLYPRLLEALGRRLSATRIQLLDLYAQHEYVPW
jgi:CRP/FNR family transcriptional regulator, cyclic AMP receptor protein